jgi:glucose-6-phosphate 1-dehydrogenase
MAETQIYRIDHYLGKETVQNMMVLRFANAIYEPIWNRRYIESVQVTVSESIGIEGRGDYYDSAGALRDMVPNHIFQLLSLIGMEPPNSFHAEDLRDEKVKLLRAIRPLSDEDVRTRVIRGQYASGRGDGKAPPARVPSYLEEKNVRPDSRTETFVAMRLEIDNWRWAGVPFYLRTGKRMASRLTEIVIQFRRAPFQLFREYASPEQDGGLRPNLLVFQIQPLERIQTYFAAKLPGPGVRLGEVVMDFDYVKSFGRAPETGYETLLFDVMNGDATLFQRTDQIEVGWEVVDPILRSWSQAEPTRAKAILPYAPGSWGPKEANELLTRDGNQWQAFGKPTESPAPEPSQEVA